MSLLGTRINDGSVVWNVKSRNDKATLDSDGLMSKEDKEFIEDLKYVYENVGITSMPTQQHGTLYYNGQTQVPTWDNYISGSCTISGETRGEDAKTYTATFTPTLAYIWEDGTRAPKNISWVINPATTTISLSKSTIELDSNTTLTDTCEITTNIDGEINISVEDENVCTASINNNIITVILAGNGTTTITINIAATNNYTMATASIEVECTINISPVLEENSIVNIAYAARNGTASTLWSVGDSITVKLNGTLGPNTLENVEVGLQIIGFNHNPTIEGNNTIHFQCGVKNGIPMAFYWENGEPQPRHHTTETNAGGWEQSDLRTILCPQFYNCLPQEWQNVIQTTTKYTNNVGQSDSEEAVTATQDKVFLLAEYEVLGGNRTWANQYEKNKQQQYEYYINGTPYSNWNNIPFTNIRQRAWLEFSDLSIEPNADYWWLRSPFYDPDSMFCYVNGGGDSDFYLAPHTVGFTPAFAIS